MSEPLTKEEERNGLMELMRCTQRGDGYILDYEEGAVEWTRANILRLFATLDAERARAEKAESALAAAVKERENRPRIVCLCGSTRFMEYFHEAGWQFTMDGYIVLSVGCSKHLPEDHGAESIGPEVAARLDELHLRKVDLADSVFVLNVGGYIGESTRREIAYAEATGKPVSYLETGDGEQHSFARRLRAEAEGR